jgi:hypothetical protein
MGELARDDDGMKMTVKMKLKKRMKVGLMRVML